MFFIQPTGGPGLGVWPSTVSVCGIQRSGSASAIGEPMFLALDNEDAAVADNNLDGGSDSGFANFVAISNTYASDTDGTGAQSGAIVGLCQEAVADNAEAEFVLFGVAKALVQATTHNVAKGDFLIFDGAAAGSLVELDGATSTESYKIVGIALEASTGLSAINVLFNGISGFGSYTL